MKPIKKIGRPVTVVTVPPETLAYWKRNCDRHDKTRISKNKNISMYDVSIAFNKGRATKENIKKITDYFKLCCSDSSPVMANYLDFKRKTA